MMRRLLGAIIITAAFAAPIYSALADETIPVSDNGEVNCSASKSDLTRVALVDDEFVAVSRIETGVPSNDISIVHEPTRGDLYLSVPEGYNKSHLSFFGTTRAGYVYKFTCRVQNIPTQQVFVRNEALEQERLALEGPSQEPDMQEASVQLVRAMFEQREMVGYSISDVPRAAVNIGDLKIQLTSQYFGPVLTGQVMRIENTGSEEITLTDALVGGRSALAVSVGNRALAPGQATSAFVVVASGEI